MYICIFSPYNAFFFLIFFARLYFNGIVSMDFQEFFFYPLFNSTFFWPFGAVVVQATKGSMYIYVYLPLLPTEKQHKSYCLESN